MPIEISPADAAAAEEFLATVVAEAIPSGRFGDGTALRDLVIKGLSIVAAQFRKENNIVQSQQSFLRLRELAASRTEAELDPSVAIAADSLASNWFLTRGTGGYARGLLQVTVTRKQDYPLPRTARFLYDRTLAFFPDNAADTVISASALSPVLDFSGNTVAYTFTLRVVAAQTGEAYNVFPSTWAGTGDFSPYVTRVNNLTRFEGGSPRQTTLEMIDSAENAISVRNLINDRSIQATLPSKFSYIRRIVNIGMGDPEMQRDLITGLAAGTSLHVGGHFDVYLDLAASDTVFEGPVGGLYVRPDGVINVFRDSANPNFGTYGVLVGDVLRVLEGPLGSQQDYVIAETSSSELFVSETQGFPLVATGLTYYIYRPMFGPDVQVYPTLGVSNTGVTSNTVHNAGRVTLLGEPHYDIVDVAVVNPTPGDPYVNSPDGFVHFINRVNDTPTLPTVTTDPLPFQVIGRSPLKAQSAFAFDQIAIPADYEGKRLRVTYQTIAGFGPISSFTRDRFERVLCANVLARGMHPVYVTLIVPYVLSPLATGVVDELRLRQRIVAFINSFDPRDVIDVSDIIQLVRTTEPRIGSVIPFQISYDLLAPDGRIVSFVTSDRVAMDPAKLEPLPNPQVTLNQLLGLGVSDRTTRYLTRLERVFVEQRPS